MPKPYTFPTLYDDVLQIDITKLKEWGYLVHDRVKEGILRWSINGEEIGSVSIKVNMHTSLPYLRLNYNYRGEPRSYQVYLDPITSNLGKGVIWYFKCPVTHKRCRKLYSIGGHFLHRDAFKGCMYESQTKSKKYREMDKTFGVYFKADMLFEQLYQKHFKKTYAGKPTKKYLRLLEQIEMYESVPYPSIDLLL
ncbi:hypothetical protein [Mangrovimonas sp. ST2L15]|uniref:hypothetical protein n=1 Tax=Mangrovimonas sp. ST2L15 TaxID=1645916 RepID=UPI0006B46A09|nr:hypothetical protein [Mangrovimonas sp. ST2L15]